MGKVGIIVDSSCGLMQKEAEKKGLYYAPIVINFDGKDMKSGVDITNDFLYKNMTMKSKVKTSAVPMATMFDLITKAEKENDSVIIITISKYISSGNDNAKVIAKDFKNVTVYDSKFVTPWIFHILDTILDLASKGKKDKILDLLARQDKAMWGILAPETLEFLYSGGRISKTQYIMGNLLKIIPLIPLINGELDNTGVIKTRSETKAGKRMADELDIEYKRLIKSGIKKNELEVATINVNSKKIHKEIRKALEKKGYENIGVGFMTPEIISHTGPKLAGCGIRMKNLAIKDKPKSKAKAKPKAKATK